MAREKPILDAAGLEMWDYAVLSALADLDPADRAAFERALTALADTER